MTIGLGSLFQKPDLQLAVQTNMALSAECAGIEHRHRCFSHRKRRGTFKKGDRMLPRNEAKRQQIIREMTIEILDKAPYIRLPTRYMFTVWRPWVQNYNGELRAGAVRPGPIYARIWITKFAFNAKRRSRASTNPAPPDYLSRFRIFLRMQLARGFCLCLPLLRFFFAAEILK